MKNALFFSIALFCTFQISYSQGIEQNVLATSGGIATGTGGSVEWTLGELVIGAFESDNNQVTQGFHQTYLLKNLLADLGDTPLTKTKVAIFPNPTADIINITIAETTSKRKKIELIDMSGRRILSRLEFGNHIEIDLNTTPQGIYYLRISDASGLPIGRFKVVKL